MSLLSNNQIARAIYALYTDAPSGKHAVSEKVVQFLARKRLISKAPEILKSLEAVVNEKEGKHVVKVESAHKLTHELKTHLAHALKKRYSNKEIILHEEQVPSLLGGLRLEVDDEVIDLSVKNKIQKLQEYLTTPA